MWVNSVWVYIPVSWKLQPLHDFFVKEVGCIRDNAVAVLACLRAANISAIARAQDIPRGDRSV